MSSLEEKEKEDLKSLIINYRKKSNGLNSFLLNPTTLFNRSQIAKIIEEYERKTGIGTNRTHQEIIHRIKRLEELLANIYPPPAAQPAPSSSRFALSPSFSSGEAAAQPAPSSSRFALSPSFSSGEAPPSILSQVGSQALVCESDDATLKELHLMRRTTFRVISQIDELIKKIGGGGQRAAPYPPKSPFQLSSAGIKSSLFPFVQGVQGVEILSDEQMAQRMAQKKEQMRRVNIFLENFLKEYAADGMTNLKIMEDAFQLFNSDDDGTVGKKQFNNFFAEYIRTRTQKKKDGNFGGKLRYKKCFKTKKCSHSYKKHSKSKKYSK